MALKNKAQPKSVPSVMQLGLALEGVGTALDLEEGLLFLDHKTKHHAKAGT